MHIGVILITVSGLVCVLATGSQGKTLYGTCSLSAENEHAEVLVVIYVALLVVCLAYFSRMG